MGDPSAISAVRARHRTEREQSATDPHRRAAILKATESALDTVQLHALSVALITGQAGVARGTFYAYFSSKYAVVAALLDDVMVQMYDLLLPYVDRQPGVDARTAIAAVITESAELWQRHRRLFRASHEHRYAIPELAEQWHRVTEQFTDAVAGEIDREIAAGNASAHSDTRQLAATLVWMTEHLLYVAGAGLDDDLPTETDIVTTLINVWIGAIYQGRPTV